MTQVARFVRVEYDSRLFSENRLYSANNDVVEVLVKNLKRDLISIGKV